AMEFGEGRLHGLASEKDAHLGILSGVCVRQLSEPHRLRLARSPLVLACVAFGGPPQFVSFRPLFLRDSLLLLGLPLLFLGLALLLLAFQLLLLAFGLPLFGLRSLLLGLPPLALRVRAEYDGQNRQDRNSDRETPEP